MTYCLHNNYIGRCPISISSSSIFSKSACFQRSFCASLSSFVFCSPSFIKPLQPVHCVFSQYTSYTPQVQNLQAWLFYYKKRPPTKIVKRGSLSLEQAAPYALDAS